MILLNNPRAAVTFIEDVRVRRAREMDAKASAVVSYRGGPGIASSPPIVPNSKTHVVEELFQSFRTHARFGQLFGSMTAKQIEATKVVLAELVERNRGRFLSRNGIDASHGTVLAPSAATLPEAIAAIIAFLLAYCFLGILGETIGCSQSAEPGWHCDCSGMRINWQTITVDGEEYDVPVGCRCASCDCQDWRGAGTTSYETEPQ